jgi:hypothetical protein
MSSITENIARMLEALADTTPPDFSFGVKSKKSGSVRKYGTTCISNGSGFGTEMIHDTPDAALMDLHDTLRASIAIKQKRANQLNDELKGLLLQIEPFKEKKT